MQEDWDSESDCCMFGVWMFHRRYADRLLKVCALDVSVLHFMGFDRRDMASARRDAFFRTSSVCVGGLSCGRRSPSVVLKAFAFPVFFLLNVSVCNG